MVGKVDQTVTTGKGDADMRFLTEVDRVLFGAYISKPYDTQYLEMRWGNRFIPRANDLTRVINLVRKNTPSGRVRASCSICKEGRIDVHRWMFCCADHSTVKSMEKIIDGVIHAYWR